MADSGEKTLSDDQVAVLYKEGQSPTKPPTTIEGKKPVWHNPFAYISKTGKQIVVKGHWEIIDIAKTRATAPSIQSKTPNKFDVSVWGIETVVDNLQNLMDEDHKGASLTRLRRALDDFKQLNGNQYDLDDLLSVMEDYKTCDAEDKDECFDSIISLIEEIEQYES